MQIELSKPSSPWKESFLPAFSPSIPLPDPRNSFPMGYQQVVAPSISVAISPLHIPIIIFCSYSCCYFLSFQDKQGGQVGLTVDCEWAEANSDKIEDKIAAARRLDFQLGW